MYPKSPKRNTRSNLSTALVALLIYLFFSAISIASPAHSSEARALTKSLIEQHEAYRKVPMSDSWQAEQALVETATARKRFLEGLMESDPSSVIQVAIPASIRSKMPGSVQALVESRQTLHGRMTTSYLDYRDGSYRLEQSLMTETGRIALHFATTAPQVLTGMEVSVEGVQLGDHLVVDKADDNPLVLGLDGPDGGVISGSSPEPVPNTFGEQSTLIILVNFQDDPVEPYTAAHARDVVINQTGDFFLENSYGQTWLAGEVTGWHTIALDSSGCDGAGIRDLAEQAAIGEGYDPLAYDRLVYTFPQNGCDFWGSATVGGTPSRVWLNGELSLELTGHEMGHNLGLSHSHSLVCDEGIVVGGGSAVAGTDPWAECTSLEYGDGLDIMGWSASGHFTAYQKERLGWLGYGASPALTEVLTDGTFEISPYASGDDGNPKALKVLKATDVHGYSTWYYLEYRQATGYDNVLADSSGGMDSGNVLNGVTVHVEYDGNGGNSLFLLDMTPETNTDLYTRDPALVVGEGFVDPDGVASFAVDAADSAGLLVSINVTPQETCTQANPQLSVSPSESQWVEPGTPVTYTIQVGNRDGANCPSASFDISAAAPLGWSAQLADGSLSLEPGEDGVTSLTVTSDGDAPADFYDVTVNAANSANASYSANSTVTYVVTEPASNQVPVAVDDDVTISRIEPVVIAVLGNDHDPDSSGALQVVSASDGSKGTVRINADHTVTYSPSRRLKSSDSFTYRISDGTDTATATVTIVLQKEESTKGGGKGGGKKK